MKTASPRLVFVLACLVFFTPLRGLSAPTLTDLGTLGGSFSFPLAVNASGQVVGVSSTAGNTAWHAFIWDPINGMRDINPPGSSSSRAIAITASGQVLGYDDFYGFVWDPAQGFASVGTLGGSTQVRAINEAGQVVGDSYVNPGTMNEHRHAFIWDRINGMRDLTPNPDVRESVAYAINASGRVAGNLDVLPYPVAFVWDPVIGLQSLIPVAGTTSQLGGSNSQPAPDVEGLPYHGNFWPRPVLLNDAGQVIGSYNFASPPYTLPRGFIWHESHGFIELAPPEIPQLNPQTFDSAGRVIGGYSTPDFSEYRGFLWDSVNGLRDIHPAGSVMTNTLRLNSSGQVLGTFHLASGEIRGYIWDATAGVQELGSLGGNTFVYDLNDAGDVAGSSGTAGNATERGFTWSASGGMRALGTLGGSHSEALFVTPDGLAVGYAYTTGDTGYHAFVVSTQGGASDVTAPTITTLSASKSTLWPANHKLVAITLNAQATDDVGVTSLKIISVTSNEPDNGLGDGDTARDIQITGNLTVNLRAERAGGGSGRVYTITVEAADAAGNATTRTIAVTVPKNGGGK